MLSRRTLLSGSAWALSALLSGCGRFANPDPPLAADDPKISNPDSPLTIDVHVHVFNGTDIPVERYVRLVRGLDNAMLKYLAGILELAIKGAAPDAKAEWAILERLNYAGKKDRAAVASPREQHRAEQYERGVTALKDALVRQQRTLSIAREAPVDRELANAINALPDRYTREARTRSMRLAKKSKADAAVAFALQQFNYRYVNTFDYLEEYGKGTTRKADLAICPYLDFDWALSEGRSPITTVKKQAELMEQISILSSGRIHAFAPFDPYKQVAFRLGLTSESSLGFVQQAVLQQGHIGVKMYPPMGFAPFGNRDQDLSFWNKNWIADGLKVPDLGARLDAALAELYAWCRLMKVPIMAHTAPSNMPAKGFCWATHPDRWRALPVEGLQVNFGHFGDTELGLKLERERPKECGRDLNRNYTALMSEHGMGTNFYADSAYLTDAVAGGHNLERPLADLFRATQSKGTANLADRLMYGSDWSMLLIEKGDTDAYLRHFESIFARLDEAGFQGSSGKISDAFFGRNAAAYLGLRRGSPARNRLDDFYKNKGIPKPLWAVKVDCLDGCPSEDRLVSRLL